MFAVHVPNAMKRINIDGKHDAKRDEKYFRSFAQKYLIRQRHCRNQSFRQPAPPIKPRRLQIQSIQFSRVVIVFLNSGFLLKGAAYFLFGIRFEWAASHLFHWLYMQ